MSTIRFVASTVGFGFLLLAVIVGAAFLLRGGPAVPWWTMIIPSLVFGLTVTCAIDQPLNRS
jgi:hypothetical protein